MEKSETSRSSGRWRYLTIDGEDHIVDLNPETEVLIYHKPTGQVCSNVPTEKMIVFSATYPRAKRQMDHGGAP